MIVCESNSESEVGWSEVNWVEVQWREVEVQWSEARWSEVKWSEANWSEVNLLSKALRPLPVALIYLSTSFFPISKSMASPPA